MSMLFLHNEIEQQRFSVFPFQVINFLPSCFLDIFALLFLLIIQKKKSLKLLICLININSNYISLLNPYYYDTIEVMVLSITISLLLYPLM